MLGKGIFFLISIIVLGVFLSDASAEENSELIILEIDKNEYNPGDKLTIFGTVLEKKMPVIAMRTYDPDGGIISANNVEIEEDNVFSKTIFLNGLFYEKPGPYEISFDYGKEKSQIEFVISNKNSELEIIEEPQLSEIVLMSSDKFEYTNGDFVEIRGKVSQKSEPTVLIGLYDPYGFPAGFYFGDIDSNLEFAISFLIKDGVNFKTFGTYSIMGFYEESELSVEFEYMDNNLTESEIIEESTIIEEQKIPINEEIDIEKENSIQVIDEKEKIIQEIIPEENKTENIELDNILNNEEKKISTNFKKSKTPINENNLSVEDIALGIMLNQITLSCDDNDFVDSISYYDGMGPALMRLCNFSEAINHFDLALIDDPNNVQILTNKGSALNKLGLHNEAITFFDYALEINPNFLPAINNKANTLVNLGKVQNAIENYNLVLSLDPNFILAKQNLDFAQKQFSNNFDYTIYKKTNDNSIDSITQMTNKVADSTINTVNKINEDPSNVFEQIGVVFSMISTSFFSFLN